MASSSKQAEFHDADVGTSKPKIMAPEGLTEDTIRKAEGNVNDLFNIADQFVPKVNTSGCNTSMEIRERLLCAYRQADNVGGDLDKLGDMMEQLKRSDHEMRKELSGLFEKSGQVLREIVKKERVIHTQLEQETDTKDYINRIKAYRDHLKQPHCRVVVAGQVSAGKSTLLNLFLGEKILPTSSVLSCTAAICELIYGDKRATVDVDGTTHPIHCFEDKDKYITKQEEGKQTLVQIYTPVSFLQSGITLVDTPGIGGSRDKNEVLTDYVTKNDVFGFIFVIKCDDAGGVLTRFKEMLRRLSNIKDEQGQCKLDPKSVIFVANFWDKVKDKDKPAVEKKIKDTLKAELRGIDLNSQVFFVNSRFAWDTWQVGLISEDYEKLIQAVERFFPIGHKRKLHLSYMWLRNLQQRALHPVQTFLNKAEQEAVSFNNDIEQICKQLDIVDENVKQAKLRISSFRKEARARLIERVKAFLDEPATSKAVTTWKFSQVPKKRAVDSWKLVEQKIDREIDARLSSTFQDWEVSNQHFRTTGQSMVQKMQDEYAIIFTQLDDVEKHLRSMSEETSTHQDTEDWDASLKDKYQQPTFKVSYASYVSESFSQFFQHVTNRVILNTWPAIVVIRSPSTLLQHMQSEQFSQNSVKFTERHANFVFKHLKASDLQAEQQVDDQLQAPRKAMEDMDTNLCIRVQSNRALVDELQHDLRDTSALQYTFKPILERLYGILEDTVSFMYRNIHDYEFPEGTLEETSLPTSLSHTEKENFSGHPLVSSMLTLSQDGTIVSLLQMRKDSAFKLRHLHDMAAYIRSFPVEVADERCIAAFIGTAMYNHQPGLVFKGLMVPAREVMIGVPGRTASSRSEVINSNVKPFMLAVSSAVEFLHRQRLVHVELSVDSVYVQGKEPKLTNIFESMEVVYPSLEVRQEIEAGNYVYIAPETFPDNEGKKYSPAADVYALGLMLMELWMQTDLYEAPKRQKLQTFMRLQPETALFDCTCDPSLSEIRLQGHPEELVGKCLNRNPKQRPSLTEFLNELMDFSAKTPQFVEV